MKDKKIYNYAKAFAVPYTIQRLFKNFSFKKPVVVMNVLVYLVALAMTFLFLRAPIEWLGTQFSGAKWVLFFGLPYLVVQFYVRVEPDGKKAHVFVYDYAVYYVKYRLIRRKYCHNKAVETFESPIVFEPVHHELRVD